MSSSKSSTRDAISTNSKDFALDTKKSAAATGVVSADSTPVQVLEDGPQTVAKGKGYQLTDHVRKYYKRARF